MANNAYAILITEDNIKGVIQSEAGLDFDLADALLWVKEHGGGWFLREEDSPLDCQFFAKDVFEELYTFTILDENSLIRSVTPK